VVDHGFEPGSGQTKDYEIGICCLSAKDAALRRKSKDWLVRNQDNVSECSDILPVDYCFSELAVKTTDLSQFTDNFYHIMFYRVQLS
jgi:hypothetical protein